MIDNAMRSIEKENKKLKDILPKNFARPELDKRRLGDVVDLFTKLFPPAGTCPAGGKIMSAGLRRTGSSATGRLFEARTGICLHLHPPD